MQKDTRTDPVLTNVSVKYSNASYIGLEVMPRLNVEEESGYYYTFDKSGMKIEDSKRALGAEANTIEFGLSQTAYGPLTDRALQANVYWKEKKRYPGDIYVDSTENVQDRMDLALEKEIADMLTDTAQVTQNITLSGTSQFSDFANSDPFGVITTGMQAVHASVFRDPNTAIMGKKVWDKVKNHPDLIDRLSNASVRVLTRELFASLIEVDTVLIGEAQYNTADEGQTPSMDYVWGKHMILAFIDKNVRPKMVTLGLTLTIEDYRYVDTWTEEKYSKDVVRVNDFYDPHFVASGAAYLIKNAIA